MTYGIWDGRLYSHIAVKFSRRGGTVYKQICTDKIRPLYEIDTLSAYRMDRFGVSCDVCMDYVDDMGLRSLTDES